MAQRCREMRKREASEFNYKEEEKEQKELRDFEEQQNETQKTS